MRYGGAGSRQERADRLRPLFAVQLAFAERLRALRGEDRAHGLIQYTNLHRRMGYGIPGREASAAGWHAFVTDALKARDKGALLECTVRHFALGTEERPLPGHSVFGCFSYTEPGQDGGVRIHFIDRESDPRGGALAAVNVARRRGDLARMTRALRRAYPEATHILGKSWLYNLQAYRRLFPAEYIATRTSVDADVHFQGGGCWGQLQTRAGVNEAACALLHTRLPQLDALRPWRVFALVPQAVQAPLEVFEETYLEA